MDRSLVKLSWGIVLGLAVLLSLPVWPKCEGRALAAEVSAKDSAKVKQARQLYKEGQYEDAAKIFSSLSVEYPDKLAFTRNLGACYYHLRRPEPAISNLREYLKRSTEIPNDDRAEVEGWIAEMEKLRDQAAAATTVAPATPAPQPAAVAAVPTMATTEPTAPSLAQTQPVAPEVAMPVVVEQPPTPTAPPAPAAPAAEAVLPSPASPNPGHGMRVAGLACGAIGLASVITAVYFHTRAASLSDKLTTADNPSASDYQSGKNAQTMQWVFYSVGAAALATGSVLYYLGWRATEPGQTAVAPIIGPGFAGLSAKGAF
jgi:tetratricopeptide (TPR) repeat protein